MNRPLFVCRNRRVPDYNSHGNSKEPFRKAILIAIVHPAIADNLLEHYDTYKIEISWDKHTRNP